MEALFVTIAIAVWILTGLATGLWMARRGHGTRWTPIAVLLGPLFVPIALDRVEHQTRTLASSHDPVDGIAPRSGLTVLVGVDGSAEADHAIETALALTGPGCGRLVLAEVVDFDTAELDDLQGADAATDHLDEAAAEAARILGDVPIDREVLVGSPGRALRDYAHAHQVDVVVVGRRGRGVSERLLGSVSADLLRHSEVPVLVVEPSRDRNARHRSPDESDEQAADVQTGGLTTS